jgi:hypothetical protein
MELGSREIGGILSRNVVAASSKMDFAAFRAVIPCHGTAVLAVNGDQRARFDQFPEPMIKSCVCTDLVTAIPAATPTNGRA